MRHAFNSLKTLVLLFLAFVAGIAATALWFSHREAPPKSEEAPALSGATEAVLQHVNSPLEIRFYSVLDPEAASEALRQYAARVEQLLAKYEREAGGKVKVVRYDSLSLSNANAARADGIKGFNLDKGDGCYLGLAVSGNGQKELIPSLSPEWEPALESDLTRAIGRAAVNPNVPTPPPTDPGILDSVNQAIPNPESVSLDEGTRVLRQAALAEFAQAGQDLETKVKAAQDKLAQALAGGSEAEQQAAMKEVQQAQTEQNERLKAIAAKSKAQIEAFKQLKSGGR